MYLPEMLEFSSRVLMGGHDHIYEASKLVFFSEDAKVVMLIISREAGGGVCGCLTKRGEYLF